MAVEMSRLARLQMAELEHVSPTTIVCFDSATGSVTPGTAVVSPRTTITNSIGPAILVTGNTPVEVILSGLTEFAPFKRFPTELRCKIWENVASEARDLHLRIPQRYEQELHRLLVFSNRLRLTIPGMLQANSESREIGKRMYKQLFNRYDESNKVIGKQVYFNPAVDTLFLTMEHTFFRWEEWANDNMYRGTGESERQQGDVDTKFCSPFEMEMAWAWETQWNENEDGTDLVEQGSTTLVVRKKEVRVSELADDVYDSDILDENEDITDEDEEEESDDIEELDLPPNIWLEDGDIYNCASASWEKLPGSADEMEPTAEDLEVVPYLKKLRAYEKLNRRGPPKGYEFERFCDVLEWDKAWRLLARMPALYEDEDDGPLPELDDLEESDN